MKDATRKRWAVRRELRFAVVVLLLGLATSVAVSWAAALWPMKLVGQRFADERGGWALTVERGPGWITARTKIDLSAQAEETRRGGVGDDLPAWASVHEHLGHGVLGAMEIATGWPLPCLHRTHVDRRFGGIHEWDSACRGAILGRSPVLPAKAVDDHLPIAPLAGRLVADTAFWAIAWTALLLVWRPMQRLHARLRRRRSCCGRCAYPMAPGGARCSECGTPAPYVPPIVSSRALAVASVCAVVLGAVMFAFAAMFSSVQAYSPLHRLAYEGDVPRIAELVNGGADINVTDEWCEGTPLDMAAYGADAGAIRAIIELGADPGQGRPPQFAAIAGSKENVVALLEAGADVHQSKPVTALWVASLNNDAEICRILIDACSAREWT